MGEFDAVPVHWTIVWTIRGGGALLIVFFLLAPFLPRNHLGGIRYCYTLADDEVWRKVHMRFRWAFLLLGLICWTPLPSMGMLFLFTAVLCGYLIVFVIWSYFYAKGLYVAKYGTAKVVCRGLFTYEPPKESDGADEEDGGET